MSCVCVCVCVAPGLWHGLSLLHGLYPDMMLHACTAGGVGGRQVFLRDAQDPCCRCVSWAVRLVVLFRK